MEKARLPLDPFAVGIMLLLCSIWGLQQVAIKVAAPDIAPALQIGLRSGVSALLVRLFMLVRGEACSLGGRTLAPGLVAGVLFAAEFLCVAKGLEYTSASHMAVFLYTAPAFTALGLHLKLPAERLAPRQWLGIGIAFCGIVAAFSGGFLTGLQGCVLLGDGLGLLAGACWGATTVVIRCTPLSDTAPGKTLIYQLTVASLLLLVYAAASGQTSGVRMTGIAWGSLLFQAVVVSFASYLTWFWLLTRYLASRLAAFSFLTPLFGISFGVLLLRESVDRFFGIGALLVLAGVVLVSLKVTPRLEIVPAKLAVEE